MSKWKVERRGERIVSSRTDEDKGFIITRIIDMDVSGADKQVEAVKKEIQLAEEREKQAKHNLSPAGRENLIYLERQKLQMARDELKTYRDLLKQYEEAIGKSERPAAEDKATKE